MSERVGLFLNDDNERLFQAGFRGTLQTPGGSVNLFTDFGNSYIGLLPNLAGLSSMVPGLVISEMKAEKPASLFLLEDYTKSLRFDESTNTVILTGNANDFIDGQAVLWTSYWLMEAQRQENSLFTLHSSALKIGDKGILLLGHSGAGKTTVMLDLCRKYNGRIISNDLTIVRHNSLLGELDLVNGTKDLRLRRSTVFRSFPDLIGLFKGTNGSAWEDKIAVSPEQINLVSSNEPSRLDAIFEIHLDSKEEDPLLVERDEGIPLLYCLYEDMSRIVKGSAISVFSKEAEFLGYMPSLDNEDRHNKRVDCINDMVKRKGILSISGGNLDELTETVYKLINSS
ncbi:MAG: hypothetical protein ABIJ85_00270 [bacterium]